MTKKEMYLITPSLLNSWLYLWQQEEPNLEEFITILKREPIPQNSYMLRGIEFEDMCCRGEDPIISPIIENGAYQVVSTKEIEVCGMCFLMYGRLDVLKNGTIIDLKRVSKYERPKYSWSCQHQFYLETTPGSRQFDYIIRDDKEETHFETYFYNPHRTIPMLIRQFINWLRQKNLLHIYLENWRTK